MRQIARLKQQRFLSFTFYTTQRSYEKIMYIYLLFDWFSGENCILFTFSLHKERSRPATLFKKRPWYTCFPVNFAKFLRTPFLMEHLWWLLLFIDGAIPLHNFEFQKKNVPLLTKDFFSQSFQSYQFFHERVSCVKNATSRQFDRIKYVFKIWLKRSEKKLHRRCSTWF